MNDSHNTPKLEALAYLKQMRELQGSDLFLSVGAPAHIKIEGISRPLDNQKLAPGQVQQLAYQLLSSKQIADFERELELDFAYSHGDVGRFRINLYYQRGEVALVARLVKSQIPDFASLGLPPVLEKLALQDRGLILVCGAAGSGKSTTLAALIDYRNQHKSGHIICIEDPIEFLHSHKRSIVDQREVGLDTHSFANALRHVLREAPDVIMLGEIRDAQTMQQALHYAQSGHLCLATLHATTSTQAIERCLRFFPDASRSQTLSDLAQNLMAVIGQRLIPGLQHKRVAAIELMLNTPYIRSLLQRDELASLRDAIGQSLEKGLQTFDQHLYALLESGRISLNEALRFADSRTDLSLRVRMERGYSADEAERKVLRDS